MKLEMGFTSESVGNRFGINILLDYVNQSYGWNAGIECVNGIIESYEYGTPTTPFVFSKEKEECITSGIPIILSKEEFLSKLPNLKECIFYTGAGLSISAGIWDLAQLRSHFLLDNFEQFKEAIKSNRDYFIKMCKQFAIQLYETEPTDAHKIISLLQKKYHCYVFTENRDILHQKTCKQVITRNNFVRSEILMYKKNLIVVGLSKDHTNLIKHYRKYSKGKPIFVINQNVIPEYVQEGDYYLPIDVQELFTTIYKEYLNEYILF